MVTNLTSLLTFTFVHRGQSDDCHHLANIWLLLKASYCLEDNVFDNESVRLVLVDSDNQLSQSVLLNGIVFPRLL